MTRKTRNMIIGAGALVVGAIGAYVICKKSGHTGIEIGPVDFHETATINADESLTYEQYIPISFMRDCVRRAGKNQNYVCTVTTFPKDEIKIIK